MTYWNEITVATTIVPPGYLRIPETFEIIGRHFFSDVQTWTGEEARFDEALTSLPAPSQVFQIDTDQVINPELYQAGAAIVRRVLGLSVSPGDSVTKAQWIAADDLRRRWEGREQDISERQLHVFWLMFRLGMSGALGYCFVSSNGEVRETDKTVWNVEFDVACDRFEHGALNTNPLFATARPKPWANGRGYLEHFGLPLLVQRSDLARTLQRLPKFRLDAPATEAETSADIVSRFFDLLERDVATKSDQSSNATTHPVLPSGLGFSGPTLGPPAAAGHHAADDDPVVAAWALDAVARGVPVREAGEDARAKMPELGITIVRAQTALKAAMQVAGKSVRLGRPIGSKSFAKH